MSATSPRLRRLQSDLRAMQQLQAESSILHFTTHGDLPENYTIWFLGKGLMRGEDNGPIDLLEKHEVTVRLGAGYPRMMPEIRWKSTVFHPNISGNGSVCLGGYGTYWVPSLTLDELCHMLWDMVRYENYDVTSPYNREAALWAKTQSTYRLPLDKRPLRDRLARAAELEASGRTERTQPKLTPPTPAVIATSGATQGRSRRASTNPSPVVPPPVRAASSLRPLPVGEESGVVFLDDVVVAEVVPPTTGNVDILFIQ